MPGDQHRANETRTDRNPRGYRVSQVPNRRVHCRGVRTDQPPGDSDRHVGVYRRLGYENGPRARQGGRRQARRQ